MFPVFRSCINFTCFNNVCNCTMMTTEAPEEVIHNPTTNLPSVNQEITITRDDAAWVLANAFLILTMQTGFGMLEAGSVSSKNVANIMIKNVVDVTLGGITYWSFGYALSYGDPSNAFCGYGDFFFSAPDQETMGQKYTHYVFQFSFATASTTIVSGAVAERMKLSAYMVFSALNTVIYCIPASWVWNASGWLNKIGFFDFAGGCVVHVTGGASALAAAVILGPRMGRFTWKNESYGMSSPVTALTGTFMLWWAWLAFNCGSSYGIQDNLWKTAAKVGVITLNGSIGGSFMGLVLSIIMNWEDKIFHIPSIITSVLGGLVSVTASCAVVSPAQALFIGAIGGSLAIMITMLLDKLGIDDPVGAVPVHLFAGLWGTMAVGLFGQKEFAYLNIDQGLFSGGGLKLAGIQLLGAVVIITWSVSLTTVSFIILRHTIGIRMEPEEEILGADWVEHRVRTENFAMKLEKALSDMRIKHEEIDSIAAKLAKSLAAPNVKESEGRIRGIAGPSQDSSVEHGSVVKAVNKAVAMGKIMPITPDPIGCPQESCGNFGEPSSPETKTTAMGHFKKKATSREKARQELKRRITEQEMKGF